ncbi:fimbria/pilus outer membrane usher protein [Stenotrophomonas maltophilia]|uniref:fimbria/pilus outer membrane usher protein n=1 Tax=Stenotrophomonas maltophilia TaxID=40324 RepID=UPI001B7D8759|nr:fimbria/pilus outer membrane usher protein [Stenotrophomonas maltophilia]
MSRVSIPSRMSGQAMSILALALSSQLSHAQSPPPSVFNEGFLEIGGDQQGADLSLFSFGNQVLPGDYLVDVMRNDVRLGQSQLRFNTVEGKRDAVPCLTAGMLSSWGVNVAAFPGIAAQSEGGCVDLGAVIPEAAVNYDAGRQQLTVSIPQAALVRSARGAVDPSKWDRGINAAMLDYQLNVANNSGSNPRDGDRRSFMAGAFGEPYEEKKPRRDAVFGSLRGGFNLGDWRFRNYTTYNRDVMGESRWEAVQTFAQRDLKSINGQLLLGDGFTPGDLFDGFQFRGAQISSDESMLPDSLRGYAPTVRGVAQTNARVTVHQNGYIIYNTYVAPGAFVLDDLYPTSSGGDLQVTITEADGRETKYTQAYSAVPTLLREGTWRYSATGGQYRQGYGRFEGSQPQPYFFQGTLARGLANEFSLYGGTTLAGKYQAAMVGFGKNMRGFGAVSVDLTHARSRGDSGHSFNGQSLRFLYAKSLEETGTTFRMAGYRYSTSGYRTFPEAVGMLYAQENGLPFANRRNELRLEVSQSLGRWGTLYGSARQQTYWGSDRKERLIQVGYSGSYQRLTYNLFYNQYSNLYGSANRQVMLTLSLPLGRSSSSAMYTASHDSSGRTAHQASVFGSAFDDHRMTYGVTLDRANQGGTSGSGNLSYKGQYGRVDLGHSQGNGYGQTNLGVAGGLVMHGEGITLSQPLGETIALVRAPQAEGVGIESQSGVRTDGKGSAVLPNVTPYRTNRVALNTQDLGDKVEVRNAAMDVVPTRGAVVRAHFETAVGYRLMLVLKGADGRPLPFGSRIENEAGQEVGVVGPEGQAYVTGAPEAGTLKVIWGRSESAQCTLKYALPQQEQPSPIRNHEGSCL